MEYEKDSRAQEIVRKHVWFSMIAGAVPIPLVDIAAVTGIQIDLIRKLADHYSAEYDREKGKVVATALIGTVLGASLGRAGASVVKAVPGIGTILGIGSQAVLAGASTYALGRVFSYHFARGGNVFDFDVDTMRNMFRDFFRSGKTVARNMRKKPGRTDILDTLDKLKELKDSGAITQKEYEETKKELLEKLKNM
mgnify:FL=1